MTIYKQKKELKEKIKNTYSNKLCLTQEKTTRKKLTIQIRSATIDDMPEMQELFVGTIRSTCKNDYGQEQINVWTATVKNKKRWNDKLTNQYFLIAEVNNKIVGYGSLENGDYLDFIYVHKDYLRQGIADRIYRKLEKESTRLGFTSISSDVSITAKPFFEKKGFRTIKENKNMIDGIKMINYRMRKEKNS